MTDETKYSALDQEALRTRAAALEPQLGYSLQGYIDSLRPAQ